MIRSGKRNRRRSIDELNVKRVLLLLCMSVDLQFKCIHHIRPHRLPPIVNLLLDIPAGIGLSAGRQPLAP